MSGREHFTWFTETKVVVTVFVVVPFLIVTVAPGLKPVPFMISGTVRVFRPDGGV